MTYPYRTAMWILVAFISACTSTDTRPTASGNNPKKDSTENLLLGSGFGIENATILVRDMDSASKYYSKVLGFTMPGKPDKGLLDGTLSSYVRFADFSSFELLSVKDSGQVKKDHPFITSFLKQHEGVRMYSLYTSSIDSTARWLQMRGLKTDTPHSGRMNTEIAKGWDWDDGGPQWRSIGFAGKNPPADLPSFMEITGLPFKEIQSEWKPYSWRKYYEQHSNGVVGIRFLQLAVSDLQSARNQFKKIGLQEMDSNDSTARFTIANKHQLHLAKAGSRPDTANNFFKTRGAGVYAIGFEIKNFNDTKAFLQKTLPVKALVIDSLNKHLTVLKEYAYGVQLEFIEESKEQAELARIFSFKQGSKLDTASAQYASKIYKTYCSLCHGNNREGYAADNAPSLRSKSLMATTQMPTASYNYLSHAISYGRTGTAMSPYAKTQGGPLDGEEIDLLIQWMHELSGVKKPIEMSAKPVKGDVVLGKKIYNKHCASCHGAKGEGISAPALGNPMLLATASDAFLRYTISEGRDSTPMPSFKDSLSKLEINAITAFLRSRASGWNTPAAVTLTKPLPKDYILNPNNSDPGFTLKEGMYVSAKQVLKAIKDSSKMIILDARSEAGWHQSHIPGAISVPYYKEPVKFIKAIPNDSTWVVVYCACPHAASMKVVNTLKRYGYKHTAILDEGILVWTQLGYPVQNGQAVGPKK